MVDVVIIGAGALGRFFAASVVAAGHHAVLVAREPGLSRLKAEGVRFRRNGAQSRIAMAVAGDCLSVPSADLVLLCVKAEDLPAALELAAPLADAGPAFVTVQNGVEAPGQVAARFPAAPVIASRVHGFFELHDGAVHHVGVEPSLAFGLVAGEGADALDRFGEVLADAGIEHQYTADIWGELWRKFLLAASLGGVGAALGTAAGRIRETERGRAMLTGAMEEIVALGRTRGIALGHDPVARTLAFVEGFPAEATTSMQRDLEAGRPSEYGCLTGAVIRMARQSGLGVPVHEDIARMIAARGLRA